MRHCPECRRSYRTRRDVCPECWVRLEPGAPPRRGALSLVYETGAFYEADMVASLLENEGIPCLKVPGHGALPWPLASACPLVATRLYVRSDMQTLAAALIAEVTGGGHDPR